MSDAPSGLRWCPVCHEARFLPRPGAPDCCGKCANAGRRDERSARRAERFEKRRRYIKRG